MRGQQSDAATGQGAEEDDGDDVLMSDDEANIADGAPDDNSTEPHGASVRQAEIMAIAYQGED